MVPLDTVNETSRKFLEGLNCQPQLGPALRIYPKHLLVIGDHSL